MQKKLISKRTDKKGATRFFKELNEHLKDGWTMNLEGDLRQAPRFFPYPSVVLTKDEAEDVVSDTYQHSPTQPTGESTEDKDEVKADDTPHEEPNLEAELEVLHGKEELLAFAAKHNIEVPEDKPWPKAIKKHISEALKANNE